MRTMMGGTFLALVALLASAAAGQAATLGKPEDVAFPAADGSTQRYILLLPEGFAAAREYDLLIALHGHGADRWQFATDGRDEVRAARDSAAKYGMIYVSPDYRAATSWMGPSAESDVVRIITNLRKQYQIGKIFISGASMGGSSALTFTALHPDLIAGVISMNGTANHLEYANFQEAITASFGGTKTQVLQEYKRRSAEYWPEAFTMPVAITAGGQDTLVPPQSVLRLGATLKTLNRPVKVLYRENGGHSTTYADAIEAFEFVITAAQGPGSKTAPTEAPAKSPAATPPAAATSPAGLFFAGQKAEQEANGTVDLGLKFTVTKNGTLTAFFFLKPLNETVDTHTFRLWNAKGECVLTADTARETADGWQQATLAKPFAVKAGEIYTLSYTATKRYPAAATAFAAPIVKEGVTATSGAYNFENLGKAAPEKTFQQMSYYIDLAFTPAP